MTNTTHFSLPKPDTTASVADEFYRLINTLDQIDAIFKQIADAVTAKAAANHTHAMEAIPGLVAALSSKMEATRTFTLGDLRDVSGAADAARGYILAKTALGFSFQSAAALLGSHQHGVADIVGLAASIDAKIAALVASSPATLDTLAELATALGNDPNFATTIASQIADASRLTHGTIPDARLPDYLQYDCAVTPDWNYALYNGWYMQSAADFPSGNGPVANHWSFGQVIVHNASWVEQRVTVFTTEEYGSRPEYVRWRIGGAWTAWMRVYKTNEEIWSITERKRRIASVDIANPVGGVDFTAAQLDGAKYIGYEFVFDNIALDTAGAGLWGQVSTTGGATWEGGASDYAWGGSLQVLNGINAYGSAATNVMQVVIAHTNDGPVTAAGAENGISGIVRMIDPPYGKNTRITCDLVYSRRYDKNPSRWTGYGTRKGGGTVNGIRFIPSAGTIQGGFIHLYGIPRH